MTLHEAASLIRAARHPRSELERDLAISRLTLALARDIAKDGDSPVQIAREIVKLATVEVA